jgi:hypothetical protein
MKKVSCWNGRSLSLFLAILVLTTGCSKIIRYYDPIVEQNLEKLKAFHLKFIGTFTEGTGKQWDSTKFVAMSHQGDSLFNDALQYLTSKHNGDSNRRIAVEKNHSEFRQNCKNLSVSNYGTKKTYLFPNYYAGAIRSEIEKNYDLALEGERSHTGGPN